MMTILEAILEAKRASLRVSMQRVPETVHREAIANAQPAPCFLSALRRPDLPAPRLIAELKFRLPSAGRIRTNYDPTGLARTYAQHGAAAISVLTEEHFFGGHLNILRDISDLNLGLPILRKDFIFDPYQVLEARAAGASALLLIAAMLTQDKLVELVDLTTALGMTTLVEVHDEGEMRRAVEAGAEIIGINNRNLHDFTVSLETTLALAVCRPAGVTLVSESGIRDRLDIELLARAGIDAVLIGEALMRSEDPGKAVQILSRRSPP